MTKDIDFCKQDPSNRFFMLVRTTEFSEYVVLNTCNCIVSAGPFMKKWIGINFYIVINTLIFEKTLKSWERWYGGGE